MAKLEVIKDLCISCGACCAIDETLFEMNEEGLATAKVEEVPENLMESATDATNACPTSAISLTIE